MKMEPPKKDGSMNSGNLPDFAGERFKESQYFTLCNDVVTEIKKAVSGLIGKPEAGVTLRIGADGTPTEKIDEVAENAALSVLEADGRSMLFVSEELGEKNIGGKPEFTFVLDP